VTRSWWVRHWRPIPKSRSAAAWTNHLGLLQKFGSNQTRLGHGDRRGVDSTWTRGGTESSLGGVCRRISALMDTTGRAAPSAQPFVVHRPHDKTLRECRPADVLKNRRRGVPRRRLQCPRSVVRLSAICRRRRNVCYWCRAVLAANCFVLTGSAQLLGAPGWVAIVQRLNVFVSSPAAVTQQLTTHHGTTVLNSTYAQVRRL